MSQKKLENMTPEELRKEIDAMEARCQRAMEVQATKLKKEYDNLCRTIAEFVLDLSNLTAQPVVDFLRRMSERKYEAAAKILIHSLDTAADNAPTRAARKDQGQARRKGKARPGTGA